MGNFVGGGLVDELFDEFEAAIVGIEGEVGVLRF